MALKSLQEEVFANLYGFIPLMKLNCKTVGGTSFTIVFFLFLAWFDRDLATALLKGFGSLTIIGTLYIISIPLALLLMIRFQKVINEFVFIEELPKIFFGSSVKTLSICHIMLSAVIFHTVHTIIWFSEKYEYLNDGLEGVSQIVCNFIGGSFAVMLIVSLLKPILNTLELFTERRAMSVTFPMLRVVSPGIMIGRLIVHTSLYYDYLWILILLLFVGILYKNGQKLKEELVKKANSHLDSFRKKEGITKLQLVTCIHLLQLQDLKKCYENTTNYFSFCSVLDTLPKDIQSRILGIEVDHGFRTALNTALKCLLEHHKVNFQYILFHAIHVGDEDLKLSITQHFARAASKLDELKSQTGITDAQLDTEIIDENQYTLAGCFDNYEDFLDKLEVKVTLPNNQQAEMEESRKQALMKNVLITWKQSMQRISYAATYRSLVNIALELGKEEVATKICEHLAEVQ